ncbi:glycosyltransferase family 2 protein [Shimia biformata]|uniref:glycosyltransferase family 2 protein n=1 Tax=Shimia biformata TaxID=1294299 RepID=UPI00194DC7DF|nr:glycosyltransferase family 2 protein [Shimia biformata]
MSKPDIQSITLPHIRCGDATVLACVGTGEDCRVFFAAGFNAKRVTEATGSKINDVRSVGDALIVTAVADEQGDTGACDTGASDTGSVTLNIDGIPYAFSPQPARTDLFQGLNTGLVIHNGETARDAADWLRWHMRHHGLQAALIIDRALPDLSRSFMDELAAEVGDLDALERVVVLSFDLPLGQPDMPPEAHPFATPGAPGKDRMKVPSADPWRSPLGQLQLFELARRMFLNTARAVISVEMCDLVQAAPGPVFDRVVASRTGALALNGRHVYPWRVRKGEAPAFGDHICIQFDATRGPRRWAVAPDKAGENSVWRFVRVVGTSPGPDEHHGFYRYMALRHPTASVARIVPKTSLVEDPALIALARDEFGHNPVRMPEIEVPKPDPTRNDTAIITCMKNEGPFILEWLAYHRAIGVKNFLVYTNDCTDGTDTFLDLLQEKGLVQHRDNPFKGTGLKPQHAALQAGENEEIIQNSDWVISMDVDEFINIKVGDGTLDALWDAVGDANMISCTWRLFGNSDIHEYVDEPLIAQFIRCAHEMTRKPHQAWGFKTLFRNIGLFKKLGVHRPKGLNPQLWNEIRWVNGSGQPLPKEMYRNAWRSTTETVGYDIVQLNHYAVRSAESFLVKRDRGRVNHVDRDQGLAYWFRMNNNAVEDTSIQRMIPALRAEMDRLLADPEIAAAHLGCMAAHRAKIDELRATENYSKFYADLTGPRLQKLARMHHAFGANVFLAGPDVIPDEVLERGEDEQFFFTVERTETAH